jgi:uncharacterized membrane protein YfcA
MPAMTGLRALLYVLLGGGGVLFSIFTVRHERRRAGHAAHARKMTPTYAPGAPLSAIGFVTNFFDTLGIGSFAPTTSLFRLFKLVPDQLIPGTLMVGHALPILAQALIYITVIEVDTLSLVLLIAAAAAGSFLGAGFVSRLPRRKIQVGMGSALLVAAAVMFLGLVGALPAGGDRVGLSGWRLVAGLAGNFLLGNLMNIGIGSYAPSLIMFGLLGMNIKAVFPIMMGSCAFLMPPGAIQFVRNDAYAPRAALGLTLGGVPGVLLAAFVVRELPLEILRYGVLAVVVYTAVTMLRAAVIESRAAPAAPG